MEKNDKGLERLCKVYLNLDDMEKEKVIQLAEGLLNSQNVISDERNILNEKNKNKELKTV